MVKLVKDGPDWAVPLFVVGLGMWLAGLSAMSPFPLSLMFFAGLAFSIVGGYLMYWELSHWMFSLKRKAKEKNE